MLSNRIIKNFSYTISIGNSLSFIKKYNGAVKNIKDTCLIIKFVLVIVGNTLGCLSNLSQQKYGYLPIFRHT